MYFLLHPQLINKTTRSRDGVHSILDLVFTNRKPYLNTSVCDFGDTSSDHHGILVTRQVKEDISIKQIKKRPWRKADFQQINEDLWNADLRYIGAINDVNIAVDQLTAEINKVLDCRIPVKTTDVRKNPCKWMTEELSQAIKTRDALYKMRKVHLSTMN